MKSDYTSDSYELIIQQNKFIFSAEKKNGKLVMSDAKVKSVYDATKS